MDVLEKEHFLDQLQLFFCLNLDQSWLVLLGWEDELNPVYGGMVSLWLRHPWASVAVWLRHPCPCTMWLCGFAACGPSVAMT